MPYHKIEENTNLTEGYKKSFTVDGQNLLLVYQDNEPFILENKCGHMEMELDDAELSKGVILCNYHGVGFELRTGAVISNKDNARPLKIFTPVIKDTEVGVDL